MESKAFFQSRAAMAMAPPLSTFARSICLLAARVASVAPLPRQKPDGARVKRSSAPPTLSRPNNSMQRMPG
eukprot:5972740-Pyramimonas_sp.AAC.1